MSTKASELCLKNPPMSADTKVVFDFMIQCVEFWLQSQPWYPGKVATLSGTEIEEYLKKENCNTLMVEYLMEYVKVHYMCLEWVVRRDTTTDENSGKEYIDLIFTMPLSTKPVKEGQTS